MASFVSFEFRRKWEDFSSKWGNEFVTLIPDPISEHWHGWEPFQVLPDVGQHWDPSAQVERADQLRVCQGLLRLCGVPLPGQALLRTLGGCHERGKQPRRPGDLPNTCRSCQVSHQTITAHLGPIFDSGHLSIICQATRFEKFWNAFLSRLVANKGLCFSWKC